jgi:hypothetical protein
LVRSQLGPPAKSNAYMNKLFAFFIYTLEDEIIAIKQSEAYIIIISIGIKDWDAYF